MSILFPGIPKLLHGGDYNPEQWLDRPDILKEDIRMMKEAHVNTATLGVFAWSAYEPEEGEFRFEWLHDIMDRLYENGIYTVLATPSGARPAWLDEKYPEAMRVSAAGIRNRHGLRHNHCMSSAAYREKVRIIDTKLAKEFGSHPGLILWHISNELGGECYCDTCRKRFQEWLKRKYHNDIEELNYEWWTTFWSHHFNSFEQIDPPYTNGERTIHGLTLDWKRFNTWNMTDFMNFERDILKEYTPDIPVTTNFMRLYEPLDYFKMAKELDIVSWDGYPAWNNDYETVAKTAADMAFDHCVMRSLKKGKPFMLMESVPSLVNWHPVNKIKRPGIHRISCLQAIACGSDTVQYFQWRKGRGSYEQFHGAVIDHLGTENTRVFREVAEVGELLEKLAPVAGSTVKAKAAIVFDWNNRWAVSDMAGLSRERKQYEDTVRRQYEIFMRNGIEADIVSPGENWSPYSMVVMPMLYLISEEDAECIRAYTENGGTIVATYLTGYVNENTLCYLGGFPGAGLTRVFGLYTEEIDSLYPSDANAAVFEDGSMYEIRDFCEVIKPLTAQILAVYDRDYYADSPVVTRNRYGSGEAYYVGARLEDAGMERLYKEIWERLGLEIMPIPEGVEYHERTAEDGTRFCFYINCTNRGVTAEITGTGTDLLTGRKAEGSMVIPAYGAIVQAAAKEGEKE